MKARLGQIVAASWFQHAVIVAIIGNAILLGLATSPTLAAEWGRTLELVHLVLSALFVTELALRIAAVWPDLRRFAADRWNLFDLVVVVLSLLPEAGPLALVARLGRLLRVARMISVIPELRLLAGTMLRSLGSLGHILLLLGLIGYSYALVGVTLFARVDPEHWGSLGRAALTLFEVVTLEGWADLQAAVIGERPWAWVYFASFIVLAVFVVINLFIAVVINNLERTKQEIDPELAPSPAQVAGAAIGPVASRVRVSAEPRAARPDRHETRFDRGSSSGRSQHPRTSIGPSGAAVRRRWLRRGRLRS